MIFREMDWPEVTGALAQLASSERAKKSLRNINALESAKEATQRAEDILYAQSLLAGESPPQFSFLDSLGTPLERLKIQAVLDVKELGVLRQFLNGSLTVKEMARTQKNRWTDHITAGLADFKPQLSAINHLVSLDGEIREEASSTLLSLCEEKRRLARDISKTLDKIVAQQKMEPYLQDKYVTNREGRMVIPVKSGSQHDVKGLIHDASQSKQTVFIEPEEVLPLNNRLREVQILIQEEIARLLKELSHFLARSLTAFANADRILFECDEDFAAALLNKKLSGTLIQFSDDNQILLKEIRHPLLALQGVDVVPNTVQLTQQRRILLLSGPNAGGKTILLKSIGLVAQMARAGLPAPVSEGSRIPFFKTVDPVIGDLQSVDQNLSTFSSHMSRLVASTKWSGSQCLLLVDEICGSTDPEEGAALARSFIERFGEQKIFAVISSHLGPLKENWSKDSALEHGSLEFDNRTNKPTFQLLLGFPGRSLALSVAARLGVPIDLIDRARTFLTPEARKRSLDNEDIENFKNHILDLKKQLETDRNIAQKAKAEYLDLVRKFREQRDRYLQKALEKAEKKIENLIEDARLDRIKNKTLVDIKAELPEIVKHKGSSARPQTMEEFSALFKPGTPAFSTRLGRQVLIQSQPDSKGLVSVLADSMRIQLPWHTLSGLENQAPQEKSPPPRRPQRTTSVDDVPDLDLRGKRVDEALSLLEKWLDTQMREGRDRIKVIHGFGTEQLKKALRQYLSKSPYVAKWEPGDQTSGGDGITWVILAD